MTSDIRLAFAHPEERSVASASADPRDRISLRDHVVTVEIAEGGATGRGEGVPYPRYGESIEGSLARIEAVRGALEAGAGREELLGLIEPGAARNALDGALWDLEAKLAGCSVAERIGLILVKLASKSMDTSGTSY